MQLPDVVDRPIITFDLDEYVYGALKVGARGLVLKDAGPRYWSRLFTPPPTVMR
jgi:hypothetical protein